MLNRRSLEIVFEERQPSVTKALDVLVRRVFEETDGYKMLEAVFQGNSAVSHLKWTKSDLLYVEQWAASITLPSGREAELETELARIYAFAHFVATMDEAANLLERLKRDVAIASKSRNTHAFLELRKWIQLPGYTSSRFFDSPRERKQTWSIKNVPSRLLAMKKGNRNKAKTLFALIDITAYPLVNLLMGLQAGLFKISNPDLLAKLTGNSSRLLTPGNWVNASASGSLLNEDAEQALIGHSLKSVDVRGPVLLVDRAKVQLDSSLQEGGPFFDEFFSPDRPHPVLKTRGSVNRYQKLYQARSTSDRLSGFYAAVVRMIPLLHDAIRESGFVDALLEDYEALQAEYEIGWLESDSQYQTGSARDAMMRSFKPSRIQETLKPRGKDKMLIFYDAENKFEPVSSSKTYVQNMESGDIFLNHDVDETMYDHVPVYKVPSEFVSVPISGDALLARAMMAESKVRPKEKQPKQKKKLIARSKVHPTRRYLI